MLKPNDIVKPKEVLLKRIVEALLFASAEPLSLDRLEVLTRDRGGDRQEIIKSLKELELEYERQERSFQVVRVSRSYQLQTRESYAFWVRKLFQPRRYMRLSQPSLETLAIIAYKQPVTRPEVEAIRGVNVDGVIKTLMERELIKISGQKEVVGHPYLYRTSRRFLEHFGLNSLADLPPLEEREEPTARKIGEGK